MTLTDLAPFIAIAATGLAVLALVLVLLLNRRLTALQRAQRVVLGSKGEVDIVKYAGSLEEKLGNLRSMVEDLAVAGKDYEVRIDNCISHMGAVRFDAFHDLGGRQSTSVAFLNATDDGVVITSAVSREFARVYVKLLRDGQPDVPLAPEEMEAVDHARARGNAPFTVRPRAEREREQAAEEVDRPLADQESQAALRALERENRRRKRMGLAPVDELPPMPSSLGWPKIDPEDEGSDAEAGPAGDGSTPTRGSDQTGRTADREERLRQADDSETAGAPAVRGRERA